MVKFRAEEVLLMALAFSLVFLLSGATDGTISSTSLVYQRHPSVAHLDCARVLANDKEYIQQMTSDRISYEDDSSIPTDCQSIRQRNHFAEKPASDEEADFPVAFARAVYKDYLLIEMDLAASYAPQNSYCYALDAKADPLFKARMRSLAACFPNVFVNDVEYLMDSWGHSMSYSHVECMKNLVKSGRHWEYLILLQNHDISVKTNQELVQILKWFQGANDVEIKGLRDGLVDWKMDWTFEGLRLFRNDTRNKISFNGHPPKLNFAKGYVEGTLSRAVVDFLVNELDLAKMLAQMNTDAHGIDEIFLQTLMATDALDVPGGFTHACLDQGITVCHVTRYTAWYGENCQSKHLRHSICIFGLEDLATTFKNSSALFVNKLMPDFDFGAINCWYETLFNRTNHDRGLHRLNSSFYQQLPHVRYNEEKRKNGFVNMSTFDCRYDDACK